MIATVLKMVGGPVRAIPGDHDMEPGSLDNLYAGIGRGTHFESLRMKGYRCLFLDFCGARSGGPDFRSGDRQLTWLAQELAGAKQAGETALAFMHSNPGDPRGDGETERLGRLELRVPERESTGSDGASIGAWPENGIFGTPTRPKPKRPQTVTTRAGLCFRIF